MTQGDIKQILIRRGYTEIAAETISQDLSSIDSSLHACLNSWLESGNEEDYESHGITILGMMSKHGLKYPAALLSMNWVIRDPETAVKVINKGIRYR